MAGKKESKIAVLLFLLAIIGFASAIPAVVIKPQADVNGIAQLYPFEVAEFDIVAANPEDTTVTNLVLYLYVEDGLAIISRNGEVKEMHLTIEEIRPYDSATKTVTIIAVQPATKNLKVGIDYGFEVFTNSAATFVSVLESPLKLETEIEKTASNPNERNKVMFSITNESEEDISDIRAELIVPDTFENLSDVFEAELLEAGETLSENEMEFQPTNDITGKEIVILRLQYTDSLGEHTVEKRFTVDIRDRNTYIFTIFVIIAILVVLSFIVSRKTKKQSDIKGTGD